MSLPFIAPVAKKVFRNREQVELWRRWVMTRGQTLLASRRIVRGTCIEWPRLGRAWTVPYEVVTPGPREVLIRTVNSCVSPGTERAMFMCRPNTSTSFPYHPGYSLSGEVVQVGRKVTHLHPGDHVAASAPHASLAVVPEQQAHRVPAAVSLEEASFLQLGLIAFYGLQQGELQGGERVVVFGRGVIGQLLIQLAALHGAGFLASVARTPTRVTPPLRRQAQQIIASQQDNPSVLDTLKADVAYEATGDPAAIHDAIRATRPGGRVVLIGSPRGVTAHVDFHLFAERAITLVGAHISGMRNGGGRADQQPVAHAAERLLHLLAQQQLDVRSLISERVNPLESGYFYRRLCQRDSPGITAVFLWDRLEPQDRLQQVAVSALPALWPAQRSTMSRAALPSKDNGHDRSPS